VQGVTNKLRDVDEFDTTREGEEIDFLYLQRDRNAIYEATVKLGAIEPVRKERATDRPQPPAAANTPPLPVHFVVGTCTAQESCLKYRWTHPPCPVLCLMPAVSAVAKPTGTKVLTAQPKVKNSELVVIEVQDGAEVSLSPGAKPPEDNGKASAGKPGTANVGSAGMRRGVLGKVHVIFKVDCTNPGHSKYGTSQHYESFQDPVTAEPILRITKQVLIG
jgi:hypothetical protein